MIWDANNLYVLVEIKDESLINDSTNVWEDDSIEVYIDGNNSKGSSYDGINDFQYQFGYNDPNVYVGSALKRSAGIVFSLQPVTGGYIFECSIPWATIDPAIPPAAGNLVGLDIAINDDDNSGGRDHKISWHDTTDTAYNNPSTFATGVLAAEITEPGRVTNPSPAHMAINAGIEQDISWTAGESGLMNDIYFGTSYPFPHVATQTQTTYNPGTLSAGTTYYWQINTANPLGAKSGQVWMFTTVPPASGYDVDIPVAETRPVIDGVVDAQWSNAPVKGITRVISGTVSNSADLSGTWRTMWDANNIYFLAQVADDVLKNDSANVWDDDSVEVYIDGNNSKGATAYDGINDFQYQFGYNDPTIYVGSALSAVQG